MATILGANTLSSGYDVANSCRFATNTTWQKLRHLEIKEHLQ